MQCDFRSSAFQITGLLLGQLLKVGIVARERLDLRLELAIIVVKHAHEIEVCFHEFVEGVENLLLIAARIPPVIEARVALRVEFLIRCSWGRRGRTTCTA